MATQTKTGTAGQAAALPATPATPKQRNPLPLLTGPGDALDLLFQEGESHLSAHALERLAEAGEYAEAMARSAATVAEGLASLISCDADNPRAAGSFRTTDDVPALLNLLGNTFSTIAGLVNVGSQAAWKLGELRKDGQS